MVFTLHKGELETHLRDIKRGIYHTGQTENFRNIYLAPTQKSLQNFYKKGIKGHCLLVKGSGKRLKEIWRSWNGRVELNPSGPPPLCYYGNYFLSKLCWTLWGIKKKTNSLIKMNPALKEIKSSARRDRFKRLLSNRFKRLLIRDTWLAQSTGRACNS